MEIVVPRRDRFGSETLKYDLMMIELNRLLFFPAKRRQKGLFAKQRANRRT